MKSVLQTLKEMVIKAIEQSFTDVLIYAEKVPQSGSKNCFGVTIKEVEQKPLLKGRREHGLLFVWSIKTFWKKEQKWKAQKKQNSYMMCLLWWDKRKISFSLEKCVIL